MEFPKYTIVMERSENGSWSLDCSCGQLEAGNRFSSPDVAAERHAAEHAAAGVEVAWFGAVAS